MIQLKKKKKIGIFLPSFCTDEVRDTEHLSLTQWICVKIPIFSSPSAPLPPSSRLFSVCRKDELVPCCLDNQLLNTKISQSRMMVQKILIWVGSRALSNPPLGAMGSFAETRSDSVLICELKDGG